MFKIFKKKKLFKECIEIEQRIDDLNRYIDLEEQLIKLATTYSFIRACKKRIREARLKLLALELREAEILNELY